MYEVGARYQLDRPNLHADYGIWTCTKIEGTQVWGRSEKGYSRTNDLIFGNINNTGLVTSTRIDDEPVIEEDWS